MTLDERLWARGLRMYTVYACMFMIERHVSGLGYFCLLPHSVLACINRGKLGKEKTRTGRWEGKEGTLCQAETMIM